MTADLDAALRVKMSDEQMSKAHCVDCYNDDYNHGLGGAKECWSLKSARVVKRWRINWYTRPVEPGAFREVKTLSCYHAPGKTADQATLPDFAVDPIRLTPQRGPREGAP